MTERHLLIPIDADDYAWLAQMAGDAGVAAGEMARRVIAWAREAPDEAPAPIDAEARRREAERQAMIAETRARVAQLNAEIEALEGGEPPSTAPREIVKREIIIPSQPPAFFPSLAPKLPAPDAERPSVLDMDLSNEPRAEEIVVPADPDDAQALPAPSLRPRPVHTAAPQLRAVASMLDAGAVTLPSGLRPGSATRPAAPNREIAIGLRMGDPIGNVVRANFKHLGFSRGDV